MEDYTHNNISLTDYSDASDQEARFAFSELISRTSTFDCYYSDHYLRAAIQISKKYDGTAKLLIPGIVFLCVGGVAGTALAFALVIKRDLFFN